MAKKDWDAYSEMGRKLKHCSWGYLEIFGFWDGGESSERELATTMHTHVSPAALFQISIIYHTTTPSEICSSAMSLSMSCMSLS